MAAIGHSALGQYTSATSRALSGVDKTADFWTQGGQTLTDRLPGLRKTYRPDIGLALIDLER